MMMMSALTGLHHKVMVGTSDGGMYYAPVTSLIPKMTMLQSSSFSYTRDEINEKKYRLKMDDEEDKTIKKLSSGHVMDVNKVRFLPDAIYAVSAGNDLQVCLWDLRVNGCIAKMRKHTGGVLDVTVLDGNEGRKQAVSCSRDGTVCHFDLESASVIQQIHLTHGCLNCLVSPGGDSANSANSAKNLVVIGSEHQGCFGLDVRTKAEIFHIAPSSNAEINCIISKDNYFALGDSLGQLSLYDIRKPSESPVISSSPSPFLHDSITSILYLPSNDTIYTGHASGSIHSTLSVSSAPPPSPLFGPSCVAVRDLAVCKANDRVLLALFSDGSIRYSVVL